MKQLTLTLFIQIILVLNVVSQENSIEKSKCDTIIYKNIFLSPQFYHQERLIKLKDVSKLLKSDKEAHKMLTSGKIMMTFGYIMAGTGGFILGYNMSNENQQLRRQNLTIGGVLAAGGLIVDILATKKIKAGIDLYNSNFGDANCNDLSLSLGLSDYYAGVGLKLSF